MKTIYILTEGDYSDYHIIGAYTTRELAEKAQFLHQYSMIEEFDLDRVYEHPPGMKAWTVIVLNDREDPFYCHQSEPDDEIPYEKYDKTYTGELSAHYRVWAEDQEHALKIAQDKWYQYKAQLAGIS